MKYNKRVIIIILVIIALSFFIYTSYITEITPKEGLGVTNCNGLNNTSCAKCAGEHTTAGNLCYWKETTKQCGSFPDEGYVETC